MERPVRTRCVRWLLAGVGVLGCLATASCSTSNDLAAPQTVAAPAPAVSGPPAHWIAPLPSKAVAAPVDLPPTITGRDLLTVTVGGLGAIQIEAADREGEIVGFAGVDLPPEARFRGRSLEFRPEEPGEWEAVIRAVDEAGQLAEHTVVLRARHRATDALYGLGDSVAAGHGLQYRDYVGGDDCWRDEKHAYSRLVHGQLVDQGRLPVDAEYALVACSSFGTDDLLEDRVNGPAGRHTQIDQVVAANPTVVTLTVGANDLGFLNPESLVEDGGGVDLAAVAERLSELQSQLDETLTRMVLETDSLIVVTTYHNPVADDPYGIDGCGGECFREAVGAGVQALNSVITSVVADQPDDRVAVADVAPLFEGHGAKNGLGPDALRTSDLPFVGGLVGDVLDASLAFCARGRPSHDSWVSTVDCIHPTQRGAEAYAEAVLVVLIP
ncbi:MAG: hypothetical protein GY745_09010 [Actinomycetia bacterium]|nr:hypothetical protein [Actinomycetes bacterium]MCP4085172.1 hypothetical protein [Actinomycetes bacterium]